MKKTLITLVLAVLATISHSQITAFATTLTIGIRDSEDEKFTWGETQEITEYIPVKIEGKDITIYTEDVQIYQTLMPEYKTNDGKGSYWLAVDDNFKRCKFYMYGDGSNALMIEYEDVCIIYGVVWQ